MTDITIESVDHDDTCECPKCSSKKIPELREQVVKIMKTSRVFPDRIDHFAKQLEDLIRNATLDELEDRLLTPTYLCILGKHNIKWVNNAITNLRGNKDED
jgi:DNA-directed RNA polymerase subunit RPC12/RpoP